MLESVSSDPTVVSTAAIGESTWTPLLGIWLISLIATLGSLFFSEVMGLPPCVLCWYQRICMYPVVGIATVGLLARDRRVVSYLAPLVVVGLAVAAYHNLLYYHLIPESITPCAQGISCTERQIEWLGFITIPLLSLTGFLSLAGCLLWLRTRLKGRGRED